MSPRLVLTALAAVNLYCCTRQPPSSPPPPTPSTYATLDGELVEAGCLQPGDAGLALLVQAYESDAAMPTWAACLLEGGRVFACGVPCTTADAATAQARP